ncbi:MAG TPA: exo-alpha-sialidase [Puia sp.]
MKKQLAFLLYTAFLSVTYAANAQSADPRNIVNGYSIYDNGYIDQPYAVVLNNGNWLCVFTTGAGTESKPGQHIVSSVSSDQGKTWTKPVDIEPSTGPSASWATPYITPFGRVYVFYDFNGDHINTMKGKPIPQNSEMGWYCYKYTDDNGNTWSDRYKLPMPKAPVDFKNDFDGEVQLFWGIDKPKKTDKGMIFAFTRLGKYVQSDGEGWFYKSDNIDMEKDPQQLHWSLLPEGDTGLKNPAFGSIQEEFNTVSLNNGDLFCMYRTTMGFSANAYSRDGGKTWTMPVAAPYTPGGEQVFKNPRACPRVFKCTNGKYLFWYHNHGEKDFKSRNPVWISGGTEKDGLIYWSQPEILLYGLHVNDRMSYPDLILQDGKYWFTETQKTKARVHPVDAALLEGLWQQETAKKVATGGLVFQKQNIRRHKRFRMPALPGLTAGGFTADIWLEAGNLESGQVIFDSRDKKGRGIWITATANQSLRLDMSDGVLSPQGWDADPGLLSGDKAHNVIFIVDGSPDIITVVVDGKLCDGGKSRVYGWGRFSEKLDNVNGGGKLILAPGRQNAIKSLRIYDRYLTTSEAVSNFNAGSR